MDITVYNVYLSSLISLHIYSGVITVWSANPSVRITQYMHQINLTKLGEF